VGGVCSLQVVCVTLPGCQNLLSSCHCKSCVFSSCWYNACRWLGSNLSLAGFFLFSLFFLKNYNFVLFVVGISNLVFIFLFFIFYFYSWPFYRSFIYLQFHPSIPMAYIFFLIWSSFFYFFGLLLNWFFFSISPFIQKIICIFYFNFDILSFDFFLYFW